MLYKFKLGYNAEEVSKNIYCMKGEGTLDHSTVTKWLKKFCSGWKNLNQATSGRSKTVNSEAVVQDRRKSCK